jgi:nitrogenase-stabilizing/protective protein
MSETTFEEDLDDLKSAEDFLGYFGIDYDKRVVQVNRLHILQRFHDYLNGSASGNTPDYTEWKALLTRAYEDFVNSDARTEAVFGVFKRVQGIAKVPITAIGKARS